MRDERIENGGAWVFKSLISFFLLAVLLSAVSGCSGKDDQQQPPAPQEPEPIGELTLTTLDPSDTTISGKNLYYYGNVYAGIYEAPDGVPLDVWISVRETDASKGIGTVERIGVLIQGGTGSAVTSMLNRDGGAYTFMIAVNYRGSSLTDITAEKECLPGDDFISCLKAHPTFSKTNPKLNAQDANAVIKIFAEDLKNITVDGVSMKPSDLVPPGTVRSPVNLETGSFGGVIVGHMLAGENKPSLHNVFFSQVTIPIEHPISEGLNAAARMMDILFSACEENGSCNSKYPDMRTNFRGFMDRYHSTKVEVDGEMIYASGVFDRIVHIINEDEVGKAIRYIGEIANAHSAGAVPITTGGYAPEEYSSGLLGEKPRSSYGLPPLDSDTSGWTTFFQKQGIDFFPGITNRTAMICSFGINRAEKPDGQSLYDMVKAEPLPGDPEGTKESFGYGFLVSYRTFLSVCPQLVEETGGLELPNPSGIEAANVIVYRGGLDIKHYFNPDPSKDEIMAYFTDSPGHRHVITHRFLSQRKGEDSECHDTILNNFRNAEDTSDAALGDNCEETNDFTASELAGWQ